MYLFQSLTERINSNNPVKVGLIGAGKFGSMFLSQVPKITGVRIVAIADLNPAKAKLTCGAVGWEDALINRTAFLDDGILMIEKYNLDVVIEATGDPRAGILHALETIRNGIHIVMVNVEADVLAGAKLAEEAKSAGVVYSMAYGDQPALTCELVEWARSIGFTVIAAGKGTRYLPSYHESNPSTVWAHYGITESQAKDAGMNSKMFNSFLDGTKSSLEMAAISNATGLSAPSNGLQFPPAGMDDLAHTLRPREDGGVLESKGMVEVVSSLERDGRPVFKDLRWGVYVVIEASNDYSAACFQQYGMNTDSSGRYSAMYKPFHLIGLELNISVLSAAILNKATGRTDAFNSDVVAVTKRELKAGQNLDGEGGFSVWGKLCSAKNSLKHNYLPIGLANNVRLNKNVSSNTPLKWSDVDIDRTAKEVDFRIQMEKKWGDYLN
ncbi:MAG: flagellar biosynthesis protein FlgA [Rhodobacteraceae bacterium]|nr:MAG: flagellar biosynthesis protein FlgA [Paracoccaceae bacterium]